MNLSDELTHTTIVPLPSVSVVVLLALAAALAVYYAYFFSVAKSFFSGSSKDEKLSQQHYGGVMPSFPLGSLGSWNDLLATNKDILDQSREANWAPVAQFIFHRPCVAVIKAEQVEAVFKASTSRTLEPALVNAMGIYHIEKFMGAHSVGVTEGAEWKAQRNAIGRTLKPVFIRTLLGDITMATQQLMDHYCSIMDKSGRAEVDVTKGFHALTLDVLCLAVFRERLGALDAFVNGTEEEVVECFKFAANEMNRRISSMNPLDWLYAPPIRGVQRRLNHATAVIRSRVSEVITRRLSKGISAEDDDLLANLLLAFGPDPNTASGTTTDADTQNLVVDNIVTLLWAGHDTTASALSFAVYELSRMVDVQDRLRAEIRKAEGESGGRITAQQVQSLPYLDAVAWEVLRLHPPAIWTNRGLTGDLVLPGTDRVLKKGSCVFVPVWAVHRSEYNWERPDDFLPERFLADNAAYKKHHPCALIPFGGGARNCPGSRMAPFEFKTALATLLSKLCFAQRDANTQAEFGPSGMFQVCTNNTLVVTLAQ